MASKWYGLGRAAIHRGDIDLESASIVAILCQSGYTPNQDTHEFVDDLTNECADASYSRVTLTGCAVTYDATGNVTKWTCDPIVFTALDDTFRYMVLALSTGVDSTSRLIKWSDYTTDQTATGVDVTITPHASGLGTDTAA